MKKIPTYCGVCGKKLKDLNDPLAWQHVQTCGNLALWSLTFDKKLPGEKQ